ncbi:hypothetical protein JXO52_14765 [bacterium]|nr:hypothetical protein [bacterium]
MRERRWILFLALAGVVTFTGVYLGWKVAEGNERIRQLILTRIRPFLAEGSDIGSVEVGIGRVRFHDIVLMPRDSSYTLKVDHAEISYSLWNLARNRFVIYKASNEAVFVRPTLIMRGIPAQPADTVSVRQNGILPNVSDMIGTIRRITLARAEMYIESPEGEQILLAHELNGWLHNPGGRLASFRLAGNVFSSSRRNISIEGELDLLHNQVTTIEAAVEDSKLGFNLPLLLPKYIEALDGQVTGEFAYRRGSVPAGSLTVKHGVLALKNSNLHFRDVTLSGTLTGRDMVIHGDIPNFNGIPFAINGHVNRIFRPVADLKIEFPDFSLRRFLRETLPDKRLPLDGTMQASFHVYGPFDNPGVEGRFLSGDFSIAGIVFDGFITELEYRNLRLNVTGEGKHRNGMSLQLSGSSLLRDSLYIENGAMRISGDAGSLITALPANITSVPSLVEMRLQGGLASISGEGRGHIGFGSESGEMMILRPQFSYTHETLHLEAAAGRKQYLDAVVSGLLTAHPEWDISFKEVEDFIGPLGGRNLATRLENIDISGRCSGTPEQWRLQSEGRLYSAYGERLVADMLLENRQQRDGARNWTLDGNYYGEDDSALAVDAAGMHTREALTVTSASVGTLADFSGMFSLNNDLHRKGRLRLNNFSLEELHRFFPELRDFQGTLSGGAVWREEGDDQITDFDVSFRNGILHNSKQYDADVHYTRLNGRVTDAGFQLKQGEQAVVIGKADLDSTGRLNGTVSGSGIDVGDLLLAATGSDILAGTGGFSMDIQREHSLTAAAVTLKIPSGTLGPLPFRDLQVEAVDTTYPGQTWPLGVLTIVDGSLRYGDSLTVRSWGTLDHGGGGMSDISVLAAGNVLSPLSRLSRTVRNAEGYGELFVRFAGSGGQLIPGSGHLTITGGGIAFTDVIDGIENLHAAAELPVNSRLVDIADISGTSEKGTFTVTNRFTGALPSGLEPLDLQRLSLSLGVLRLNTSQRGLRLHFPGLMEPGEKGWIVFAGLGDEQSFLIGGPADAPHLRGSLNLRDVRLTYPFLDIGLAPSPEPSFIERVEWDLEVLPVKDVYYVRQIDNPLGNIYIDLQLRDNTGGLRIAGSAAGGGVEVWGDLISTAGTIEAIDHVFRPERITFEYPRGSTDPIFNGRASTIIIDSLGTPATVWLEMTSINDETGLEQSGGPWGKVRFRVTSDNPNLTRTEADLMSALGYSASQLKDRAYSAIGLQVENWIFRPLLRPIERGLRRYFGLDVVRFSSRFSSNLVQMQNLSGGQWDPLQLLRSSRVTVGKYLASGLFMTYTGQVNSYNPYMLHTQGLGFRHALILEYSIRPDLFLEMEYSYDSQLLAERREDKRIWLRHIFPF